MSHCLVQKRPDGGCSIIYPSPRYTLGEWLAHPKIKGLLNSKQVRLTTVDKLPQSRAFRNAWTDDNPTPTVDVRMDKARDIHMNRLRYMRTLMFQDLDVQYQKALGKKDVLLQDKIEAKRQQLRDMPQTFDLQPHKTPDELLTALPPYMQQYAQYYNPNSDPTSSLTQSQLPQVDV